MKTVTLSALSTITRGTQSNIRMLVTGLLMFAAFLTSNAQQYSFTNNTACDLYIEFHYASSCGSQGAGVGMSFAANSTIHYSLPSSSVMTRMNLTDGTTLLQKWLCSTGYWSYISSTDCPNADLDHQGMPIGALQANGRVSWVLDYDIVPGWPEKN